jgi:hypothetical protein
MTNTRADLSLSRLELVMLACLSRSKPPKEAQLAKDLTEFTPPGAAPVHVVADVLAMLRGRGLVTEGRALTESGHRALRAAFELGHTPTWTEVRSSHLPALALGLRPGSKQAGEAIRTASSLTTAVLRSQLGVDAPTVVELCDVLLSEALGMPPGPHKLVDIRAHVLARRIGVSAKGKPVEIAKRAAREVVGAARADKTSMVPALGRRWVHEAAGSPGTRPASPQSPVEPVQPTQAPSAETLLEVVRETIPRIGVDGRFGTEKVFVSAIWRSMERDRRLADLSLDRFKRWLVSANRDGWLVLARADLVGAMDARLVAESEIQDQGATFHFVLDRRAGAPERGIHAR